MITDTRWTSAVATVIPIKTGTVLNLMANVMAISWLLSPSSAMKITAVLSRRASTTPELPLIGCVRVGDRTGTGTPSTRRTHVHLSKVSPARTAGSDDRAYAPVCRSTD